MHGAHPSWSNMKVLSHIAQAFKPLKHSFSKLNNNDDDDDDDD